MTLLELKEYFESYAKIHPSLLHVPGTKSRETFFMLQPADADKLLKTRPMKRCIVVHPYDSDLSRSLAGENYTQPKAIAFMVLGKVPPENLNESLMVQSDCEQIGLDFLRWMLADRATRIKGFDPNSAHWEAIGPVIDNHYGYIFLFTIKDHFNQAVSNTFAAHE